MVLSSSEETKRSTSLTCFEPPSWRSKDDELGNDFDFEVDTTGGGFNDDEDVPEEVNGGGFGDGACSLDGIEGDCV